MGLKAAVQALQKAEALKEKVQQCGDLISDNDAWVCQQQLQRIYQQVLILDLEYALDRKVEQDLWSLGFKNYIATLQAMAKNKKNPKQSEAQAMLSWCLEAASGFYLTLLQDICTAFDLDLPFRRKGSVYGSSKVWKTVDELNPPHHSSCNYICQHCLVHLGDIARYRNQSRQAEAFYRHAVLPAPSNGHPYNQLALLEATRGDRLSTVFHYVRSVAVRCPFQAAATNLARTLAKTADESISVDGRSKLSSSEYVTVFLKLHGLLHTCTDLHTAEKSVKLLTSTLTALVATESLTAWKLVQMLVINCFALSHVGGGDLFPATQLSGDERRTRALIVDLMAGGLNALLLPVYTLRDTEALLAYFALPAIKLTLDWIRLEPTVLADPAFTGRLQIWPSLCKLLNELQQALADFNADEFVQVPLPEERDVQCFLPLEPALSGLRFSGSSTWACDVARLRAARLVAFGRWLAERSDLRLIARDAAGSFSALAGQQAPSAEVLREMSELKLASPSPSDVSSWGSSSATTPEPAPPERRTGILKPQGSLERAREKETDAAGDATSTGQPTPRRGRQNVAMQAILRKAGLAEADQAAKQVTFKSPPPAAQPPEKGKLARKAAPAPPAWSSPFDQPHPLWRAAPPMPPAAWCARRPPGLVDPPSDAWQPRREPPFQDRGEELTMFSSGVGGLGNTYSSGMGGNAYTASLGGGSNYSQGLGGSAYTAGMGSGNNYAPGNTYTTGNSYAPGVGGNNYSSGVGGSAYTTGAGGGNNHAAGVGGNAYTAGMGGGNTYSLFSSPSWAPPAANMARQDVRAPGGHLGQQSLWSGPGPSPLERLLEQQKQLREGPGPKSGT